MINSLYSPYTPFLIVSSVILFTIFVLPKFYKSLWAEIGRLLSALIFVYALMSFFSAYDAKSYAGREKFHGSLIIKFTNHIETLLHKGETEKAKQLLAKFNKDYDNALVSLDIKEVEIIILQTTRNE